jgi:DNA-3-methyladenine glycosylase I
MADAGIVRNRLKIDATIDNARAYLRLTERQSLASLLWGLLDGRPLINTYRKLGEVPPSTDLSKRMSKVLKDEGFRFVGPTTVYAFMQASGMVTTTCLLPSPRGVLRPDEAIQAAGDMAKADHDNGRPRAWQRMLSAAGSTC